MQNILRKLELGFFHDSDFYIARLIDHRAENLTLGNGSIKCRIENEIVELPVYAMSKNFKYELIGGIKFLHDEKPIFLINIQEKGGSLNENWAILKRILPDE